MRLPSKLGSVPVPGGAGEVAATNASLVALGAKKPDRRGTLTKADSAASLISVASAGSVVLSPPSPTAAAAADQQSPSSLLDVAVISGVAAAGKSVNSSGATTPAISSTLLASPTIQTAERHESSQTVCPHSRFKL